MRTPGITFLMLFGPTLVGQPAAAQQARDTSAASRAVAEALAAVDRHDWRRLVALLDPEAMEAFRRQQLLFAHGFEDMPRHFRDTTEAGSKLPPAVRAYFDSAFSSSGNPMLAEFPGVHTLAELDSLPAPELVLRYLEGTTPAPDSTDTVRIHHTTTRTVLGQMPSGDTLAYVIYREHSDLEQDGSTDQWHVVLARRRPDGWRVLLNPDIARAGCMAGFTRINLVTR